MLKQKQMGSIILVINQPRFWLEDSIIQIIGLEC